jgi:PleD family two-component response regulator
MKRITSSQRSIVEVPFIEDVLEQPILPLKKDKTQLGLEAQAVLLDPPVPLGLRILVTDDSALTRKMASRLLSTIGCICTEAEDGLEAYNLVISDLSLFDVVLIE